MMEQKLVTATTNNLSSEKEKDMIEQLNINRQTPYVKKSKLHIVLYPNEVLIQKSKPVTNYGQKLIDFAEELKLKMIDMHGDGLAAVQVGTSLRMFAMMIDGKATVFVNPKIVEYDGNVVNSREGCLSVPGIIANLNCRNDEIYIEAKSPTNEEIRMTLTDQEAIVFQHEFDHLNGLVIFDNMGNVQKAMRKKKYSNWIKKLRREFKKRSNGRKDFNGF